MRLAHQCRAVLVGGADVPSMSKKGDVMSISEVVRRMEPRRYTTSQAAALVGRSPDTLIRWRDEGVYNPSQRVMFGQVSVCLYTDEDIDNLRVIAKSRKPGRKPASTNA